MQISDDIYLGPVYAGGANSPGPSPMELGVGPLGRVYVMDMVPAVSGTTVNQNGICASQNLPNGALIITPSGACTAATDGFGNQMAVLDVPRNIAIYSAADHSAKTITVTGYDLYGQKMTETITCPNATTVFGKKAFKSVYSVFSSGAIASACVVGVGTSVGIPFRVTDMGYVGPISYNQASVVWNSTNIKVADLTPTATATTGDVRGTILLGATDGTKRLVVCIQVPAIASGPYATRIGALGVTQF